MKNAIIYVFSGTGNTQKVCGLFAAEFEKRSVKTRIFEVTSDMSELPDPNGFDYVGIGYPIHAFNAPEIVLRLAAALRSAEGEKDVFVVKTSGEPLRLNDASSGKLSGILGKKGYRISNEYHYVMPYNMIFRHGDTMAVKMWAAAVGSAPADASEILSGKPRRPKMSGPVRLVAGIFRIEQPALKLNGRLFKVDAEKCLNCGKCVKNCPTGNIKIEDGKFVFKGSCIGCARCSFNCPSCAISIGILNGWRVNGAYSLKEIKDGGAERHSWYCKRSYARYFERQAGKAAAFAAENRCGNMSANGVE